MPSQWIAHVKQYAKDHNMSYRDAMVQAKATYKTNKTKRVMKGRGDGEEEAQINMTQEQADASVPEVKEPTQEQLPIIPKKETKPKKKSLIDRLIPLRTAGLLPPSSRKLLEKIGDEKITSLRIDRAPISPTTILKLLRPYRNALKALSYDDTFHLLLVINDKYELQKNEIVNISKFVKRPKTESVPIDLPSDFDMTINELIDNTRKAMGNKKFSSYNVVNNNCQIFIESILRANKLLKPEYRKFIRQDLETLFSKLPKGTERIISILTETAARVNRLIEGEGFTVGDDYPTEPKGLMLQFSSTEMSRLQNIYYSTGKYDSYDVVLVQMYYPDNFAIGSVGKLGWQQFPRSKKLGYHKHDVEFVAILYQNDIPVKVVMSAHGFRETNVYRYDECEFENGFLKVYVARNSHSNYNTAGVKKRLKGLANDVTSVDGKTLTFTWEQMEIARDISFPGCCNIVKGLRQMATDASQTLTPQQRMSLKR